MNELKNCPFCGSIAKLITHKHIPCGFDYTPTCTKSSCPGRIYKKYSDKDYAIRSWNRRAADGKMEGVGGCAR